MAKAKVEPVESQDSFTDRIFEEVEKDFGKGVLVTGAEVLESKPFVIPWTPSLDIITGGVGIEEGSWVGITGHPKTGKTTAAMCFAANAQKPEYGSRPVFYDKVEGRLSQLHFKGVKGLDLRRGMFSVIQSTPDKILTTQDHLKILSNIIRTVPGAVVIIDSISAYCDEKEMNEGVGTETRGGGAKIFSQWCRLMNQVVPVNRTIVLGITHLISNTSGMGAQYHERAARMWGYQKDYALRTVSKQEWKAGNSIIGLNVKWKCETSKSGPPGMMMDSYLRFGTGFDRLYEVVNLGMAAGFIKKAGAWMTLSYLGKDEHKHLLGGAEPPKYQGAEKVYAALLQRPEWQEPLFKEVMAIASGLAGSEGD